MTISSRTPEGQPGSCPLCGADVVVEPSIVVGDATCPNCGQLLWFFQSPETLTLFEERRTGPWKEKILDRFSIQLGVDREAILNQPNLLNQLAMDSLEIVELVMALEEEFDD